MRIRSAWSGGGWSRPVSSAERPVQEPQERATEALPGARGRLTRRRRDRRPPRRQILVVRPIAQAVEQTLSSTGGNQLGDAAFGVGQIAEVTRTRRTGRDTGRLALGLRQIPVIDAIDAECAFAHHALFLIEFPRPVGTGPRAELAADADLGVDEHDAVLCALVRGAGRTDRHTEGILAVQAGAGQVHGARASVCGDFIRMHTVEPHAVGLRPLLVVIRQRAELPAVVPFLAAHRTGMATDAGIEVDDQSESLGPWGSIGQHGHQPVLEARLSRTGFAPSRGATSADASRPQGSIATVTSNQAACPVTGSEFECGASAPSFGRYSEMTWLRRNARRNSGELCRRAQAPARLPIAFQVQTVSRLTPVIVRTWHLSFPLREWTHTQSSSWTPRLAARS